MPISFQILLGVWSHFGEISMLEDRGLEEERKLARRLTRDQPPYL
jgi:hypothetical protein